MADLVAPYGVAGLPAQAAPPPAAPSGPWDDYQPPPASPAPTAAPAPANAAPSDGPWADYQAQQQPATGRDALGGYVLPPQQPDPAQPAQPTSFMGRVAHGVDDVVRSVEQGATFGFGDELNAAEQTIEHPLFGTGSNAPTMSQRYAENLAAERARMAQISPYVAVPGQLAGGAATIMGEAPLAGARGGGAGVRRLP